MTIGLGRANGGGRWPRWSHDGSELFFVSGTDLMAVRVSTTGDLNPGHPQRLFSWPGLEALAGNEAEFDVSADARRFLVFDPADA